jgi:hypothetical protein
VRVREIVRNCAWLALGFALLGNPARAAVFLTTPDFSDLDSFTVALQSDAPLGFSLDAVELTVSFDAPLALTGVNKQPAVPGSYDTAVITKGFISYLTPATFGVGKLFEFSFDGATASPATVNVELVVFPVGNEEGVTFFRTMEVSVAAIPEPGTLVFLATGVLGIVLLRQARVRGWSMQAIQD